MSSVVIGVASTAPAYSLAATLGFIVAFVGLQAPIIVILAFIPMLFVAIGYQELNKADPDCGTTFTWATRAFGPKTGWMGGWGILAADILVMSSLAQVAGQYVFLLFNADGIGSNPTSGWVLLVGIGWIVLMTYICYRGVELSARLQQIFLVLELIVLAMFVGTALYKVARRRRGPAVDRHLVVVVQPARHPRPLVLRARPHPDAVHLLGLGQRGRLQRGDRRPGEDPWSRGSDLDRAAARDVRAHDDRRAVLRRHRRQGHRARQRRELGRHPRRDRTSVFGDSTYGSVMVHLLIFLVLTSAAASTQTTILPTARTSLAMAVYKALPDAFARMHKKNFIPTVSTVAFGAVSIVLYIFLNYTGNAINVIGDCVSALGMMIAFYYGLTGFTCFWYYRHELTRSPRSFLFQGVIPLLGGLILFGALGWSLHDDWVFSDETTSYTSWLMPFPPHWRIGGVFLIGIGIFVLGLILMYVWRAIAPAFFRGETLNRDTATLVPDPESVA